MCVYSLPTGVLLQLKTPSDNAGLSHAFYRYVTPKESNTEILKRRPVTIPLSTVSLFACLSVSLSFCPPVCLCLYVCLPVFLPVCLSASLSTCLSVWQTVLAGWPVANVFLCALISYHSYGLVSFTLGTCHHWQVCQYVRLHCMTVNGCVSICSVLSVCERGISCEQQF